MCFTTQKIKESILQDSRCKEYYSQQNFLENSKPFLLDKVASTQKITLVDYIKIVKSNDDTARVLNPFCKNIVSGLKVNGYNNCDPFAENRQEPVLKR